MQTRRAWWGIVSLTVLSAAASLAQQTQDKASKPGRRVTIGSAAPGFELKSCTGKPYRLADFKDKLVVLEWINQDCPISAAARPTLKATAARYAKRGVVWLAIDSTHYQTPANNAKYARDKELPYPILMDSDGKVGRLYGAKVTPHIFIVDKGKLVYMGAHDNQSPRKREQRPAYRSYIAEALDAVLAGKNIPSPITQPYGCTVKYKKEK